MCGFFIAVPGMMDKGESTQSREHYQERESGSGDSLGGKSITRWYSFQKVKVFSV